MNHICRVTEKTLARLAIAASLLLLLISSASALEMPKAIPIVLGQSLVKLNRPWKFHTGDNPVWANPDFDDATWETVDLTALPGAHDGDVGLSGYVSGWAARGYRSYIGYAWYRLRIALSDSSNESLALTGPPAVDSAYQLFVNGRLLGGCGHFSGNVPTVFSIQPRRFVLQQFVDFKSSDSTEIAIRVWMGPWDLADDSGGIRIAPTIGEASSINLEYQRQWLETFCGYIVEVVEAIAFIFLAVMAWTLSAFQKPHRFYDWLAIALVLTACYRANQALFFWGQFETVHAFEAISVVFLIPACLVAWTLAWQSYFNVRNAWIVPATGLLTLLYLCTQFLTASWFYGMLPHWMMRLTEVSSTWTRISFAVITIWIAVQGIRHRARLSLLALLLISIGQFAPELSRLGIPGIWFPYGTGVSRTQYAYAAFDIVLFVILLRQFLRIAQRVEVPSSDGLKTSRHPQPPLLAPPAL
jgi:hypothetical protein